MEDEKVTPPAWDEIGSDKAATETNLKRMVEECGNQPLEVPPDSDLSQFTQTITFRNGAEISPWTELCEYVQEWFYEPDLEALEISLAACYCHQLIQGDPVWLFFIGPASSGKTALIINSCASHLDSVVVGDLGPDTLLSAWQDKKKGLLSRHPNPILLFKDFSTFLTKRPEQKREVEGQLREVYDGYFRKDRGVGFVEWSGKATVIAATTPAIDRHWGLERELGERFLSVRIKTADPVAMARFSFKQRGNEKEISSMIRELAKRVLDMPITASAAGFSEDQKDEIASLAYWLGTMRASIWRENGSHDVFPSEPEAPARAFKVLTLLCRCQAVMKNLEVLSTRWAQRVAFDSCHPHRFRVFQAIPPESSATEAEISKQSGLHTTIVKRTLAELEALKIVDYEWEKWSFTEHFSKLCRAAKIGSFLTP